MGQVKLNLSLIQNLHLYINQVQISCMHSGLNLQLSG